MSLDSIEKGARNAAGQAQAWITELVEQHLPALAVEAARAQASPVIQALEGVVLPPETEHLIASLITKLAGAASVVVAADVTTTAADTADGVVPVLVVPDHDEAAPGVVADAQPQTGIAV
jgi:hypothetical protein